MDACKVYENDSNVVDAAGRPPHSVEVVVDGGSNTDIAAQILATKSGGINTYGNITVEVPGEDDDTVEIHFNRPVYIYLWFKVALTIGKASSVPANYAELVEAAISWAMDAMGTGDDVVPQQFLASIYAQVPGISYIDISVYQTKNGSEGKPAQYPDKSVVVSPRERAVTSPTRIEVSLNG